VARRAKGRPVDGWLVLDKPAGLTSTQAMAKARRLLDARKAGHGGTLDPIATGVLPIAFGEATKTVGHAMDGAKTYAFAVRWGEARDTDDREGEVVETSDVRPGEAAVRAALPAFVGEIEQLPPRFSALKVDGARAYDLARAGIDPELAPRRVRIDRLALVGMPEPDTALFETDCGKGTYVRSLARDLARALGTVGHVAELRRLRVGPFVADDAVAMAALEAAAEAGTADALLRPVGAPLAGLPAIELTEAEAARMRNGQAVALVARHDLPRLSALRAGVEAGAEVVLASSRGRPVALARLEGAEVRPVRVLLG